MEANQDGRVTERELPSIDEMITNALTALDNADRAFTVATHGGAVRVPDTGGNLTEVSGATALAYAKHLNAQALGYGLLALAAAQLYLDPDAELDDDEPDADESADGP